MTRLKSTTTRKRVATRRLRNAGLKVYKVQIMDAQKSKMSANRKAFDSSVMNLPNRQVEILRRTLSNILKSLYRNIIFSAKLLIYDFLSKI